ncbi:MAG: SPOR domain-containing protein [Hydrogenothermaceae bacterium]
MENRDLKDVFKTVKEKKKKEKIERLLIYMSGILLTLVFVAIGLNFFSGKDKNQVSEPDIKIVKDINQPSAPPQIPAEEKLQEVKIPQSNQNSQTIQQPQTVNQPQVINQPENQKPIQTTKPTQNISNLQQVQNNNPPVKSQPKKEETVKQKTEPKEPKPATIKETKEVNTQPKKEEKSESKYQVAKEEKSQSKKEETHKDKKVAKATESTETTKKPEPINKKTQKQTESKNEVLSLVTSGYFSIQTGAFSSRERALAEKSKYKDAFIIEENGLYKVLVGKFKSDKEAREYRAENNIPGFIKRINN